MGCMANCSASEGRSPRLPGLHPHLCSKGARVYPVVVSVRIAIRKLDALMAEAGEQWKELRTDLARSIDQLKQLIRNARGEGR